jgi:hypothetical protein
MAAKSFFIGTSFPEKVMDCENELAETCKQMARRRKLVNLINQIILVGSRHGNFQRLQKAVFCIDLQRLVVKNGGLETRFLINRQLLPEVLAHFRFFVFAG